jgi:hypothetical protein
VEQRRGLHDAAQCAGPEDLADDGGILEQGLFRAGQAVETGGKYPLQRLRQGQVVRRAPLQVELRNPR